MTNRKASLIAPASFANAFATSGASSTKFVPARYRFAYLPRIPPLSSWRRSYSGRNSSFVLFLGFFIGSSFTLGQGSSTDDPGPVAALRMSDHQQATPVREPDRDVPMFVDRVVRVSGCDTEEIAKHCSGLIERNPVLAEIRGGFARIPLELHASTSVAGSISWCRTFAGGAGIGFVMSEIGDPDGEAGCLARSGRKRICEKRRALPSGNRRHAENQQVCAARGGSSKVVICRLSVVRQQLILATYYRLLLQCFIPISLGPACLIPHCAFLDLRLPFCAIPR